MMLEQPLLFVMETAELRATLSLSSLAGSSLLAVAHTLLALCSSRIAVLCCMVLCWQNTRRRPEHLQNAEYDESGNEGCFPGANSSTIAYFSPNSSANDLNGTNHKRFFSMRLQVGL